MFSTVGRACLEGRSPSLLGKDEVASSNLASSSKPLILLENQGFFLFSRVHSDRILFHHLTGKDAVYLRQKLNISTHLSTSLEAVYKSFIISQTSRGISDATITNYHNHLRGIAKLSRVCDLSRTTIYKYISLLEA